jgi:hypothetical protein
MSAPTETFHPLRPGLLTSAAFNRLSDRAENLFVRLLLVADDFGHFHATPELVRAACWPLKSYRTADVARTLDELERAGMIARYTAQDSCRYLALHRFQSRMARRRALFPQPAGTEPTATAEINQLSPPEINQLAPSSEREREKEKENQKEKQTTPRAALAGQLALMPDDPATQARRTEENTPATWSDAMRQAWRDWLQHRSEIKHKMTPLAQRQQLAQIAKWTEEQAIDNIHAAIRSGWRGLYESRPNGGQFAGRGRPAREMNPDVEARLRAF